MEYIVLDTVLVLFMLLLAFLFKLNFIIMITSFVAFRIIWYVLINIAERR